LEATARTYLVVPSGNGPTGSDPPDYEYIPASNGPTGSDFYGPAL
jgi:hypothetical protein